MRLLGPLIFDAEFLAQRFGLFPTFERVKHLRYVTRHGSGRWVGSH
jgi:hypothetical protein